MLLLVPDPKENVVNVPKGLSRRCLEAASHMTLVEVPDGASSSGVVDCVHNGAVVASGAVSHLHWCSAAEVAHTKSGLADTVETRSSAGNFSSTASS